VKQSHYFLNFVGLPHFRQLADPRNDRKYLSFTFSTKHQFDGDRKEKSSLQYYED